MGYLLHAHGFVALSAMRGDDGLELLRRSHPDLVVCDIQLPGLDGYAIAKTVKADSALQRIPLMAVTALAMVGDREKVLAAGFDDYVTKPIDPQSFMSHVQSLLGASLARRAEAEATQTTLSVLAQPRGTLLVVDDSAVNRELKRSIFEPHGYRVITAATVAEGLKLTVEHHPSAIITDIGLPDGNGLELLQAIKADPGVSAIPVLMITSTHAEAAVSNAAMSLGASRFLIRPLDPERVLSEVEAVIAHPG